jgi:[NiFe] hydrogenase diaphorase moiety large subunit
MLLTDQERLRADIEEWSKKYGKDRSALLPILEAFQRKHGQITEFGMQVIADMIGIHPVEVYGFTTFFSFLGEKPKGKFVVRLCRTISCDMQGKDEVARQLENDLGITFGETTKDKKFTLEWANCLGMCDQGPALLVNEKIFTRVTPQAVHDILDEFRKTTGAHAIERDEENIV